MSTNPSILTIKRRSVTLTIEQIDNLASEYYGTIAQMAGGDDDDCLVSFANPVHATGFSRALESFHV